MTLSKRFRASLCSILAVLLFGAISRTSLPPIVKSEPGADEVSVSSSAAEQEPAVVRAEEYEPYKEEAEYAARVIYGTAKDHSDADQRLVVWCIINRVECSRYPDTIKEVCQQSQQWMGYSDSNPVLRPIYKLALEEITAWHSGSERSVPSKYIYLVWSSDDIVLKNSFEDSEQTRYWKA